MPSRYLWQILLSSGKNHQIATNPIITAKVVDKNLRNFGLPFKTKNNSGVWNDWLLGDGIFTNIRYRF